MSRILSVCNSLKSQDDKLSILVKVITALMLFVSILSLVLILTGPVYDGDIWFHLLYGKAIVENLTITPDHSLFSWTPSSNNNIYCAWVGQLIFYFMFQLISEDGVIFLRYFLIISSVLVIITYSIQRGVFVHPLTWLTLACCVLVINQVSFDKPELFSVLYMTVTVWIWYKVKESELFCRLIYLFPVIMLIWVNTHGGFVYGCLFLLSVGIGETLNRFLYRRNFIQNRYYKHLLLSLVLSFFAIFCTPYGDEYIIQILMSSVDGTFQNDIKNIFSYAETFQVKDTPHLTIFANVAAVLLLLVFFVSLKKGKLDFVPIISNLMFAYLFSQHLRFILPWIPVFGLTTIHFIKYVEIKNTNKDITFKLLTYTIVLLLFGWLLIRENSHPTREAWLEFGVSERYTISDELAYMSSIVKEGNVGNMYNLGAYILWKKWPDIKVMIDARYFPYKKWAGEYFEFRKGRNINAFVEKYPFEIFVLQHTDIALFDWFLKSKDWKLVFYGKSGVVFQKKKFVKNNGLVRGESLRDIRSFRAATAAFYTSVKIRDWEGSELIKASLESRFKNREHIEFIAGLLDFRNAIQLYDKMDYDNCLNLLLESFKKQTNFGYDLYASTLLRKAFDKWSKNDRASAIMLTGSSLKIRNSFTGNYNLAMMMYLMKSDSKKPYDINWREIFKSLINQENEFSDIYPKQIHNIKNILMGSGEINTQLLVSEF